MTDARLVLVVLAVDDLAQARRFYEDAFGWPLEVDAPPYKEFRLPGGLRLGLYRTEGFALNTRERPADVPAGALTRTELYLHVDDPAATGERLVGLGARLLDGLSPRDWGDEAAYYADPAGNVLVVARPLAG